MLFAMENGKARLTPVTTGQTNGLATRILDGVADGTAVILHPDDRVADGVRVTEK
jgi:HlyD family secretion protein